MIADRPVATDIRFVPTFIDLVTSRSPRMLPLVKSQAMRQVAPPVQPACLHPERIALAEAAGSIRCRVEGARTSRCIGSRLRWPPRRAAVDGGVRADIDLLEGRSEPSASTTASGRLTSLGDAFGDDEASVLVMVDLQSGYGFWRFTDRHRELLMERFPKVRVAVLGRRRGRVT